MSANNQESLAYRAAFDAFFRELADEIQKCGPLVLRKLDDTVHRHASLVNVGDKTLMVLTTVEITSDPKQIEREMARRPNKAKA